VLDDALSGGGKTGALIRALDWSKTPLGPVDSWPQSLKTSVSICLNSRFPVLIWWGPELVKIYNDAYVELIGSKHPWALGSPGIKVWPEIWDTIEPLLTGVMERGEASWSDDLLLMLERNGYAEECYFTFSYSPIRDESGGIGGVFTPVMETTEKVIGERRLLTLRSLAAARSSRSRNVREACFKAGRVLALNPQDVPFAGIYLFDDGRSSARLGASAVPNEQAIRLPATIDLRTEDWLPCERLMRGETCVLAAGEIGLQAVPVGAWGTEVVEAIAVPIRGGFGSTADGFLLAGVSPKKRLDERYHTFFAQVAEELGEAIREARMVQRESELLAEAETERRRIRDLFMQAPAGILMLQGPQHKVALVNAKYLELVGRRAESDLIGRNLAEAMPEIMQQGFTELLDEVYRSGMPFWGNEMKVIVDRKGSSEGSECYFNFVYQPMRDAAGTVEGVLVHVVEVTEQVMARREVESREEQLRVLADSIPQMAWMADANGDLFWYNRRWYEYTGTTFEEMKGWGWQSVHVPELLPGIVEQYKKSLASGEPFNMTFPLRGADGTYRNFLTLAMPVRDASGKIARWFGTNTDIEAQKRTEDALRQSEKLAAVGRLASSIAHEINNPLEAVTNLIYLARGLATETEVASYLETAEVELSRMAQITTQTLRFHKQLSAPMPTDVGDLLESLLPLYKARVGRLGIEMELDLRDCPPLVCYAGEIRQVLANLVGNAIDAMSEGGKLCLRVRAGTDWRWGLRGVRITVADTGHGMSPQTMRRLFEPFFTTKETVGTGLGLWVSAGIVEKHRGTLRVRSSAGRGKSGTVFALTLPYEWSTGK
jgi:PAS domain S-box-containing protein